VIKTNCRIAALKFFRNLIGLNYEFYNQQMIQEHLFEPIINMLLETSARDNLLNSACLDFFEYIRNNGVPVMVSHIVQTYRDKIQDINYVETFKGLIMRYDHSQGYSVNVDTSFLDTEEDTPGRSQPNGGRRWQGMRDLDPAEEEYFNTSDDEDEAPAKSPSNRAAMNGASPVSKPLVDYPSDEETDMTDAVLAGILPSKDAKTDNKESDDRQEEHKESSAPIPPERLSEKRRREEDEEDELMKLSQQQSKRRSSSSSVSSVGSTSSNILRRKNSFKTRDGNVGSGKKIAISLSPAIKSGGDGGAETDDIT
jgi:protein phosphatase-4 regulatory subunit 3